MSRGRKKKLTSEEQVEVLDMMLKEPETRTLNTIRVNLKCKTEKQKELVNLIKTKDITICSGYPGSGKAQPLDSLVLTPNGFIRMGDLKLGDLILTPDNKESTITGIFPQGSIDVFKVTFSDGTSTECCGDHLWYTQTERDRRYRKFNRVDGKKVYYGDFGRDGSVKSLKEISETLDYYGKSNHSIPITNQLTFKIKNLPINPYLLGLLLGDGGLTTNIGFSPVDDEILENIKNILGDDYFLNKNGDCTYKIVTKRGEKNELLEELENLGLRHKSSIDKFIPEIYKLSTPENRIELLRGLLDTDGSVNKTTGSAIFYSISKKLVDDVRFIVESLGGVCTLTQKIGRYKKDGVVVDCNVCYVLTLSLPTNINPFKLKRKAILYKPKTKYFAKRFIKSVEYIGKKEAQCIMIDDPKHLYITNNFIVTHNTYLSCAVALELLKNNPTKYKKIVLVKSVTTLKDEEIGFLKGPQPLYEKVLTPEGWVTMGDIKIGDSVINKNGKAVKVINVFNQSDDEPDVDIYRITTKDGKYVDSCINHKWNIRTNDLDYFTVNTDFLIKHLDKVSFYLPEIKPVEFLINKELPVDPYLIGVLLGDGSLTTGHVRFTSIDDEIINRIREIVLKNDLDLTQNNISYTITSRNKSNSIKGAKQIRAYNVETNDEFLGFLSDQNNFFKLDKKSTKISNCIRSNNKLNGYSFEYTNIINDGSNNIKNALIDLKLIGLNCYNKHIPKEYKFTTINNRIELLRGLLDTDGTIKNNGEITFTSVSEELINDVAEIVRSLGGSARKYKKEPNNKIQVSNGKKIISRVPCYTLTIRFFNNDINPFFLTRKANKFKPTLSQHNKIAKIEKIGTSRIKCIEIDDPDHLYITKDYILTHNTMKEKMEPFMYSFIGNFEKIISRPTLENLRANHLIEEQPLAYIRGITIDNAIIIVDETQNISKKNLRSIMTRLGEDSKMIFLGDEEQIDMKDVSNSSLSYVMKHFAELDEVGTIFFGEDDVVRHPLIKKMEQIFRDNP